MSDNSAVQSPNKAASGDESIEITIKPKKKRAHLRRRRESNEEEDATPTLAKLEEMKELQNLRKRPHGVSLLGLALGKKVSIEEEVASKDPFKVKTGGMVNMQALRSGKVKQVDDAYDTGIGTQFSVETNKRDEDEDMMKYIEEQLSKRKGNKSVATTTETVDTSTSTYCTPEEAALQAVPGHLRESSTKRSEEMLSNQMLSGIPEVDLGIEAKIKNIEATEEAKLKLLWERNHKKDGPSQFVPSNMAVNFVQHNRFNIDASEIPRKKVRAEEKDTSVLQKSKTKKEEKATDDYHYEKFKKQYRRY